MFLYSTQSPDEFLYRDQPSMSSMGKKCLLILYQQQKLCSFLQNWCYLIPYIVVSDVEIVTLLMFGCWCLEWVQNINNNLVPSPDISMFPSPDISPCSLRGLRPLREHGLMSGSGNICWCLAQEPDYCHNNLESIIYVILYYA